MVAGPVVSSKAEGDWIYVLVRHASLPMAFVDSMGVCDRQKGFHEFMLFGV